MSNNTKKETAKARRMRLAKALETAYNNGGDYEKVIQEIRDNGDWFDGMLGIRANGVDSAVKVEDALPPRLSATSGWHNLLYMVRVNGVYAI